MSDSRTNLGCCRCCLSFIFTSGLTALFLWLSLRVSSPKCSLQSFYLPSLDKTLNTPKNNTLVFNLRLENTNKDKGVYYDPINVTFSDNHTTHRIANFTIPGFYQGHKKKANKGNQSAVNGVSRGNGTVVLRVDMVTWVRYKIVFWKTKRHKIMVGGDFKVTDQGIPDVKPKKGVKLSNGVRVSESFSLIFVICCLHLVFD